MSACSLTAYVFTGYLINGEVYHIVRNADGSAMRMQEGIVFTRERGKCGMLLVSTYSSFQLFSVALFYFNYVIFLQQSLTNAETLMDDVYYCSDVNVHL